VTTQEERAIPVVRLRDLHPTLRLRLAIAFVERMLNTMVIPVMAIYLSAELGAATAGLLILTSVGVAVVAGLSSGHFADVFGRRRALLAGAVTMTVGFGGMTLAVSPAWSAPLAVFAFYLVQMAAASFVQPVHDAVIIDLTVPAERKVVYALNYWTFNIALAAGALLAGFLYNGHLVGMLGGAAAAALVAALLTYRFLDESAPPSARLGRGGGSAGEVVRDYLAVFRDRRFMMLLGAMTLILGLEMQRTSGYVAVHVAQDVPTQGLLPFGTWLPAVNGIQLVGLIHAANTVCVALLALSSERILRRVADRARIVVGVGIFTVACAVLATSDLAWVLLLAVLVLSIGELLHIPVMETVLAGAVPDHARAKYMAIFNLNVRGGLVIASVSLGLGAVVPPWGMAGTYLLLGLAATLLYLALLTPRRAPAADGGTPERPEGDRRDRTRGGAAPVA